MEFSPELISEYQTEMASTYGVAITHAEAQIQLNSLVRCVFGGGAVAGTSVRHRSAEVGNSITPTSVHLDKK